MRNSILAAALIGSAIMGGLIGGAIGETMERDRIMDAWNDHLTIVADGTLVANPSYYAFFPEALADSKNVRIISNKSAALDAASSAVVDTAFAN